MLIQSKAAKFIAISVLLLLITPFVNATSEDIRQIVNPTPYGFSGANIVMESSSMVYVSGQVGISDTGPNDFKSQVDRAFDNLEKQLKASGSSMVHVVKITLLIADFDPEKLSYMAEKRNAAFGDKPPASTLIPVTRLYADGVKFEIDAIAVKP